MEPLDDEQIEHLLRREPTRWERLEAWMFDHEKGESSFTVYDYAEALDLATAEATADIQSYLVAQRRRKSKTLYVLHRKAGTRTRTARWEVGTRTRDATGIGRAFYDDTRARVMRAFKPDLVRLRKLNPRAARRVEAQINSVVDGALVVLAAAVEGGSQEDEE